MSEPIRDRIVSYWYSGIGIGKTICLVAKHHGVKLSFYDVQPIYAGLANRGFA